MCLLVLPPQSISGFALTSPKAPKISRFPTMLILKFSVTTYLQVVGPILVHENYSPSSSLTYSQICQRSPRCLEISILRFYLTVSLMLFAQPLFHILIFRTPIRKFYTLSSPELLLVWQTFSKVTQDFQGIRKTSF